VARFAAQQVLRPAIRRSIAQVRSADFTRVSLIPTPALATPRQRQKRRIDPKVSNPDLPRIVNQRTVPAKMRKQWIHQTIQEATPQHIHLGETSGTEEEHMDIDHGNRCFYPLSVPILIVYQTRPSCLHHPYPRAASQGRQRKLQPLHPPHPSLRRLRTLLNYLYSHLPPRSRERLSKLRPSPLTIAPIPRLPLPPLRPPRPSNYTQHLYLLSPLSQPYFPSQ